MSPIDRPEHPTYVRLYVVDPDEGPVEVADVGDEEEAAPTIHDLS